MGHFYNKITQDRFVNLKNAVHVPTPNSLKSTLILFYHFNLCLPGNSLHVLRLKYFMNLKNVLGAPELSV